MVRKCPWKISKWSGNPISQLPAFLVLHLKSVIHKSLNVCYSAFLEFFEYFNASLLFKFIIFCNRIFGYSSYYCNDDFVLNCCSYVANSVRPLNSLVRFIARVWCISFVVKFWIFLFENSSLFMFQMATSLFHSIWKKIVQSVLMRLHLICAKNEVLFDQSILIYTNVTVFCYM